MKDMDIVFTVVCTIFWTYPWKDNIHIFHLAPTFLKSSHWYSSDDFLKKVASCGAFHISRNISSSFVVYGYAQVKQITFLRILFPNKGNNCLIYVKTHFTKHFFSFQVCWL